MPYLPSLLLVVIGLAVLLFVVVKVFRSLTRFGAVYARVNHNFDDRAGLLRARSAALRVAIAERKTNNIDDSPAPRTI